MRSEINLESENELVAVSVKFCIHVVVFMSNYLD